MIRGVRPKTTYCVRRFGRRGRAAVTSEKSIHVEQVNKEPAEGEPYVLRRCF